VKGDSYWGPESATRLLTASGDLLVKTTLCHFLGLAATAALVAEAGKLTLGQELTVWVPHSILTLMEYRRNYWLTQIPECAM
jgi:hypothetical protein